MSERCPLVDRSSRRKVDIGLETAAIARKCRQSLGGDVLGRRLERVEPREILAPEKRDGRQVGKQKSLRLMCVHTPLTQERIATRIIALLIRAGMPLPG